MKRRVAVTGLGAITPIGNTVEEYWQSLKIKRVGIELIKSFDTSELRVKLAAEVKDFAPEDYMDKKSARRMDRFAQFAVAASGMALKDAALDMTKEDTYRVGVSIGCGIGGISGFEREHTKFLEGGPSRVSPLFIPCLISNMAAGNVSIIYGLRGKSINVVSACASGTGSIGEAMRTIQYGDADVMIAGGSEAAVSPVAVAGFQALTALSLSEDPLRASIPFDKERSGFVVGEGAGILVLEEMGHAQKRGAKIYAELIGYGSTDDAYHITAPLDDGSGAAKAMEFAMKDAEITPDMVDYINAHGTGTLYNDADETRAVKLAFGEHARKLRISSTKSMIGHLLGGAGGVEAVACVKSIEEGFVHATAGYLVPDDECDLDYVTGDGEEIDVHYCLSNSLGFGGHNAVICFGKYEG